MFRLLQFKLDIEISGKVSKSGSTADIIDISNKKLKTKKHFKNNGKEEKRETTDERPTLFICVYHLHVGGGFWLPTTFRFARSKVEIRVS